MATPTSASKHLKKTHFYEVKGKQIIQCYIFDIFLKLRKSTTTMTSTTTF